MSMRRITIPALLACMVAIGLPILLGAQESTPSYETKFELSAGGVLVDVDGSSAKFRTDRNIRSGFDTKSLFYDLKPAKGTESAFDAFTLSVSGIGDSSPYQRGDFRFGKKNLYEVSGRYQKFFMFFGLPEFALGRNSEDSVGRSGDLSVEIFPGRKISYVAGYRRNQLYGTRFASQNLILDSFAVAFPRRLASDEIHGGIKLSETNKTLSLTQSFIRMRDDAQLFPTGTQIPGLRGNTLVSGQRDLPTRISNPVTRALARWRPNRRYDITARYLYSGANVDINRWESFLQTAGPVQFPVQQLLASAGTSEKPSHHLGTGQSFDITSNLTFHHRLSYDSYTISGLLDTTGVLRFLSLSGDQSLDAPIQEIGGTVTDYQLFRNEAELEYFASRSISLVGGHRYTNRHLAFGDRLFNSRPVVTIGNAGIGGVIWRVGAKARLRAEVEKGTSSETFNRREPLDTLRVRLRGQYKASKKLSFTGNFLSEDNRNDSPGVNYDLDNRQVGVQTIYMPSSQLLLSGGYNFHRIRSTTDIAFWTLSQLMGGRSLYDFNTHVVNALIQLPVRDRLRLRGGYDFFRDTGATFPVRMHVPRLGASLLLAGGLSVEADWRYFSYTERRTAIQDYDAHVVYVGVRYSH